MQNIFMGIIFVKLFKLPKGLLAQAKLKAFS